MRKGLLLKNPHDNFKSVMKIVTVNMDNLSEVKSIRALPIICLLLSIGVL